MIEIKKLIKVIHILLTVLLVGCATKGNYVGELKDGKPHGKGTYIWKNGTKYEGEWKDGERYGQGRFTFTDGSKYVGEFKDGKKHGQGTYTYPDGRKYEGEWKDGKTWTGIFYDKNGNISFKIVNGKEKTITPP